MRTLSCTVGLLLSVSIYCCIAMPQAVEQMSPVSCCFTFFTGRVPDKQIVSVNETHRSCGVKAFVVTTAIGKQFCVGHYVNWAQKAFKKQNVIEG
uniref:C-C motif chemokine 3-like n=1 Tax=Gasterosteus aculeatus aculeatus TaxID=481459 RepID=UPI001A986F22|nr:C-C motif chemokine 3-like [Gasterosteus aculeatus aculeatus]